MARRTAWILLLFSCATLPPPIPGSEHLDQVFDRYTPLACNAEIARRVLTPLTVRRGDEVLAAHKTALREQAIDLTKEKFSIYVPGAPPPREGYGLLVYVAPWEEMGTPKSWRPVLDRFGLVFVMANNSGNETKIYDRRMPLALLAYENVRARYPIDPNRTYVGGMSGGSRTAETIALAYPDVFRAVLLNAGSNPIGKESEFRLPPAELFAQFQRTRLVYVTGEKDEEHIHEDQLSRASMRSWCVFNEDIWTIQKLGHVPPDGPMMIRALEMLERKVPIDERKLAECNQGLQRDLAGKVAEAQAAIDHHDRDGARKLIYGLDGAYSGFAKKQILDLDTQLGPP
jgi:hypothetical protein